MAMLAGLGRSESKNVSEHNSGSRWRFRRQCPRSGSSIESFNREPASREHCQNVFARQAIIRRARPELVVEVGVSKEEEVAAVEEIE